MKFVKTIFSLEICRMKMKVKVLMVVWQFYDRSIDVEPCRVNKPWLVWQYIGIEGSTFTLIYVIWLKTIICLQLCVKTVCFYYDSEVIVVKNNCHRWAKYHLLFHSFYYNRWIFSCKMQSTFWWLEHMILQ